MNTRFMIKQHDLLPQFQMTLLDNITPVDLTYAATARLIMRNLRGIKINEFITITDQTVQGNIGKVTYDWKPGDTDTSGAYKAEVEIIWQDGRPQTFPGTGYVTVQVIKDLDNPSFAGTGGITASAALA